MTTIPDPVKRAILAGSRLRPADRGRPDAAVVPDLRRPALRDDLDAPRARAAPGDPQGRAAQGRALLRHRLRPRPGLVPRRTSRCSATARAVERRGRACPRRPSSPARTTCTTRWRPQRIARDLPDVKLIVLVRDPVERAYSQHAHEIARGFETEARLRRAPSHSSRSGCAGEDERLTADPPLLQLRPPAPRVPGPRASTSTTWSGWRGYWAASASWSSTARSSSPTRSPSTTGSWTSSGCRYADTLGLAGRYPAFEQHNARKRALPIPEHVRADLTAHYEPFDAELGEWLGRPVSWRASSSA